MNKLALDLRRDILLRTMKFDCKRFHNVLIHDFRSLHLVSGRYALDESIEVGNVLMTGISALSHTSCEMQ